MSTAEQELDEQFRDLNLRLATAERELNELADQAGEAYRQYRNLDSQQTVKADEVKELRRQVRESKR